MYFNSIETKDVKKLQEYLHNFLEKERKNNTNKMRFIIIFEEKTCKLNGLLLQKAPMIYSKKIVKKAILNLTKNNSKIHLEEISDTCWHLIYDN